MDNRFIKSNINRIITNNKYTLDILREDMIQYISGNKYRKLKYNLIEFKKNNLDRIITFGGAYSNHVQAVSMLTKLYNIETLGIIRGDELKNISPNPTLKNCINNGMNLKYISRKTYDNININFLKQLNEIFPDSYIIPEGGNNFMGIKGCSEILHEGCYDYQYIVVPMGTGGTLQGILNSINSNQIAIGISVVNNKHNFTIYNIYKKKFKIFYNYNFGGYYKYSKELVKFINLFKKLYNIQLDPIYTGKMMYAIYSLMEKEYFKKKSKILAIHTGGLQGIKGFNENNKLKII